MKKKTGIILAAAAAVLALLWLRPWSQSVRLPLDSSATLVVSDGQSVTWKLIYTSEDMRALRRAVSNAKAASVEGWTVPEDPWPAYGLTVHGTMSDFEAVFLDGVWVDNEGRTLKMDLDFEELWESLPGDEHTRQGISTLPCRRELALQSGQWDPRFLVESTTAPIEDVAMELELRDLSWTVTNEGEYELEHGNGGGAGLQVCLDGRWYGVPMVTGNHYAVTAEAYMLRPGKSYSSTLFLEGYGELPAGEYRLAFGFDRPIGTNYGFAADEFWILEDGTLTREGPVNG